MPNEITSLQIERLIKAVERLADAVYTFNKEKLVTHAITFEIEQNPYTGAFIKRRIDSEEHATR